MAEDNKRLLILGSKSRGDAVWGLITGTLSDQTDLKDALDAKADTSSIPTKTSDLTNDSGYITLSDVPAQVQADWDETDNTAVDFIKNKPTLGTMAAESASDYTKTSGLATVATSGSYNDLSNTPTIPAAQIQSDWNQSDNTAVDYIKNKPTLGTMAAESASDYTKTSGLATVATSGSYNDLSNKPTIPAAQIQSDWNQSDNTQVDFIKNKPTLGTMASESASDYTPTSSLATVATTGSYTDLTNTPTIPTVNDATITIEDSEGTTVDTFTLNQSENKTITLPAGGGGSQWFGTQMQFDNLGTYDDDTDYYISDKLDYNTDLKNTPDLSSYATKTEVNTKNNEQDTEIAGKLSGVFMTQQEFDALGNNVPEGENYFIQGDTVQMVVTFTDQTTATYNVVVD